MRACHDGAQKNGATGQKAESRKPRPFGRGFEIWRAREDSNLRPPDS